ncbi:MAG: CPBP family intramembrane metalloprotease [Clostridia bacterium]|nr:CPBP family intramembrane metalloprotease [Clostridia bacterium]
MDKKKVNIKMAVFGSLASIGILIISQIMSQLIGYLFDLFGMPGYIGGFVSAIIYPIFTYLGLKLLIERRMKIPLDTLRIKKFKIKPICAFMAVCLPTIVVLSYLCLKGTWTESKMTTDEKITTIVYGVLFYSVAAGIVEEMVFRGIIMGLIEKSISVTSAVAAPSVLFGLMHIIGNHLNFLSIIQLVIGGTAVGIMFSLIELYSENFWNNALVHALWNMSTVGLMHIGTQPYSESVFTYVLKSRSILVTGGDFGIETSVISIIAYLLVIAVTLVLLSRKEKTNNIEVV